MARSSGSTVVRRRLGTALRNLREEANIRIEAAARELECSTAKVSRLENGLGPAKKLEVRALLDLYDVTDDATRTRFEQWADRTKSAGWWEPDTDAVEDDIARFIATETESRLVRMYCTPVLPVLLQSAEYNLAHVRDLYPDLTDDEIRRFAAVRQKRQTELLDPATSLRLVAILDESAVLRQVGSPHIHARSLTWLADVLDDLESTGRNDVEVNVLPLSAGTPDRAMSAYTLFTPREPELDPMTGYVEDSAGATWYEAPDDVQELSSMFDRLRSRCIDQAASRRLLRNAVTVHGDDRSQTRT